MSKANVRGPRGSGRKVTAMNQRLVNEHAFKLATELLGIIENCLRPEERRDCWEEFYRAALSAIEDYHTQAERMRERLHPSARLTEEATGL
jgi:hypothetical protein